MVTEDRKRAQKIFRFIVGVPDGMSFSEGTKAVYETIEAEFAAVRADAEKEERKKILREATCKIDFLKGECSRHFESIVVFMQDVIWAIYGNEEADEDTKLSLNEYDIKRQEGLTEEVK